MITFRQDLKEMKQKLDGITAAVFTNMANNVTSSLTNLSNNLDSTIDNLGMRGTWNDNVSVEISGNVRNGFKSVIESCKEPACTLIKAIGTNSESLLNSLTEYLNKWEEYQKLLDEKNKLLSNEPPKTIYDKKRKTSSTNDDWIRWNNKVNAINLQIKALELAIMSIESKCDSLIGVLKSLLVPISATGTTTSLSLSVSTTKTELPDGNIKISNKVLNDDGTVTEYYSIYDKSGQEIGNGNVSYDSAGKQLIEEYSIIQKDGSTKIAKIDYSGEKAVETCTIIDKNGNIINNENIIANNNVPNEEVVKMTQEPEPTVTPEPQTIVNTSNAVKGLTAAENTFINDHSHDNNKLRLFYNGQEIEDDSVIKVKEGETIQVIVKIPTNKGEHIELCRATPGGNDASKNGGISQKNSVSPNRYDKNDTLHDTGYYVWTITGKESGSYIVSQTAQFNTENQSYYNSKDGNGAFKEMCRLSIKVE